MGVEALFLVWDQLVREGCCGDICGEEAQEGEWEGLEMHDVVVYRDRELGEGGKCSN